MNINFPKSVIMIDPKQFYNSQYIFDFLVEFSSRMRFGMLIDLGSFILFFFLCGFDCYVCKRDEISLTLSVGFK